MAPAIVYDGVSGGDGGTLFDGIKFWIALRVPMRGKLVDAVKVCLASHPYQQTMAAKSSLEQRRATGPAREAGRYHDS
jgi:hypothetical protein